MVDDFMSEEIKKSFFGDVGFGPDRVAGAETFSEEDGAFLEMFASEFVNSVVHVGPHINC